MECEGRHCTRVCTGINLNLFEAVSIFSQINTHLGTSLINAYKRAPEMANKDPRLTALLMEKAHDVLTQLAANRMANAQSYGSVASMHAQVDMAGLTSACLISLTFHRRLSILC